LLTGLVHHAARAKAAGVTAADLMTSPAVTIGPDDTVEHAARLMYDRKVKRLPVIDEHGRLVGIISRTDVLAVFDRTDAEIREEIMTQVITGHSEPSWYSVIVTWSPGPGTSRASSRCATVSTTRSLPSPAHPAPISELYRSLRTAAGVRRGPAPDELPGHRPPWQPAVLAGRDGRGGGRTGAQLPAR
jgi:CBS domain-containing protein